ncbi:PP2C family protein-serine/threonine phosphatase [Rhodobium gokarnense]|uniref:Protein phosphatase n=1 Tax=Rhodobium gokarnense TaxID=364296 RepID=A0ABT3H847_9HYPH|nr:protein phosphatase 2C domain-containing protein [Rhodobium gokarnense]MCW2306559.1 protein phosphatase [Rhodobium gokarnense]
MLETVVATRQIVGGRAYQEDRYRVRRVVAANDRGTPILFAAIADGMGGHTSGERASELAIEAFWQCFCRQASFDEKALTVALHAANEAIARDLAAAPERRGMGTTFLGVVVCNEELRWVSVGDSPLLLYRSGELHRVNADHSLAPLLDQMAEDADITREEALSDPRRSSLREALMGQDLTLIDTGESFPLEEGDVLLVASDGVLTLEPPRLAAHLAAVPASSPEEALAAAFDEIAITGGSAQDNTTAILVFLRHADGAEGAR